MHSPFSHLLGLVENLCRSNVSLRSFSQLELADKLNMPLEKYIELEKEEKIPAQILLDLSHELNVCDKYLYSGNCPQNNPLCITILDFKCPHYTFDKYHALPMGPKQQ